MIRIQIGINRQRTLVQRLFPGNVNIGQNPHAHPEVLVLPRHVPGPVEIYGGRLRPQDHHVRLCIGDFDGFSVVAGDGGRQVEVSATGRREFAGVHVTDFSHERLEVCAVVAFYGDLGQVGIGEEFHSWLKEFYGRYLKKKIGDVIFVDNPTSTSTKCTQTTTNSTFTVFQEVLHKCSKSLS